MATFYDEWKKNITTIRNNLTTPNDGLARQMQYPFAWEYRSNWNALLTQEGYVINPADPTNMLDFGTLADPDDPGSAYTPATQVEQDKMFSWHALNEYRRFLNQLFLKDQVIRVPIEQDEVGLDPETVRQTRTDDTNASVDALLGVPTFDIENP